MKMIDWTINYDRGTATCLYGTMAFYKLSEENSYSIASFTPSVDGDRTEAELSNSLMACL